MNAPLVRIAATGNRFVLVDGMQVASPADIDGSALAMRLGQQDGLAIDGVLQVLPPTEGGDVRMVIHNVDGSRAEACGNGLRCVARYTVEAGHVPGSRLAIETDVGTRAVELTEGGTAARASLGPVEVVDENVRLGVSVGEVEAFVAKLGNPHCVLFVPDANTAPVRTVGPELEQHERFPDRINVEFCDVRAEGLVVRIWERGVGETGSCGTGVAAAAVAALRRGRVSSPVRVVTRGGELTVHWDTKAGSEVWLEGPVDAPTPLEDTVLS